MLKHVLNVIVLLSLCSLCSGQEMSNKADKENHDPSKHSYEHPISYEPSEYVSYRTNKKILIDGRLDDEGWSDIAWTDSFVDIEGAMKPIPYLDTKAKMTWDNSYFYIAAKMFEPHVWATLTKRDAIMFQDDDFEIFIDPDGDGHNYFEFEMNAFNAIWDLYMLYPYFIDDERNYIMNWDIRGIKTAVHIEGTINDPSDIDKYWSIEVAIPWECFEDFKKGNGRPEKGDQWRINFSRVDWTMDITDEGYKKRKNKETGKNISENNWVWSPTGYVNMHKPEVWGYIQFESDQNKQFVQRDDEHIKWAMWQLYYQVKECRKSKISKNCSFESLTIPIVEVEGYNFKPHLSLDNLGFRISATTTEGYIMSINEKGRLSTREKID